MAWETMSDTSYKCPKCGEELRIRFRMDDWSRREYIKIKDEIDIEKSICEPSKVCSKCGITMEFLRYNE
jgi:predicted RNA-binding Zn-ribbon protein involved in translation (DUF1610 family)